jgi:hypothetical protein
MAETRDTLTGQTTAERAQGAYAKGRADEAATAKPPPASSPSSTVTKTSPSEGARTVVGLMTLAVVFSLVGNTIHKVQKGTVPISDFNILLGGGVATTLLVFLTHAGDAGRQGATGLALVVAASSVLVYGGPVWAALSAQLGTHPTTPTPTTGASTPTTTSTGAT